MFIQDLYVIKKYKIFFSKNYNNRDLKTDVSLSTVRHVVLYKYVFGVCGGGCVEDIQRIVMSIKYLIK